MKRIVLFWMLTIAAYLCHAQGNSTVRSQIGYLDNITVAPVEKELKGRSYVINVRNQDQFDSLNQAILSAIARGRQNIKVKLKKGTYEFHENHIYLINKRYPNVTIAFVGKNAIITSCTKPIKSTTLPEPWSSTYKADDLIQVVDERKKICFIPFVNNIGKTDGGNIKKVKITQWYRSVVYDVVSIDDAGITFKANDLTFVGNKARQSFNINYDYVYHGEIPRFKLYNECIEKQYLASCFIRLENISLKGLYLSNIIVKGNKSGAPLLQIKELKASQICLSDCSFNYIRGDLASFINTSNISVKNNYISNISSNGFSFSEGCSNVIITRNTFDKCGQGLSNSFCIRCNEAEYYIADNIFVDFGYSAIGVGLWHGVKKHSPSRGVIEHNKLHYTLPYIAKYWQYTLMDSGAIYTWTQNDEAIIRYNYIHDYTGMWENRGIFCDDGAGNVKIYGNIILNIANSYCIDSRRVGDHGNSFRNNENNLVAYNIVDGPICYMGYGTEERHCVKGANFVVNTGDNFLLKDKVTDIETLDHDVSINGFRDNDKRIRISSDCFELIENIVDDDFIRKHLRDLN